MGRPRGEIRSEFDRKPAATDTLGDNVAWFFDHPYTQYVVRGVVVAAAAEVGADGYSINTQCHMRVVETFKGPVEADIYFETWGGQVGEQVQLSAVWPVCNAGEEVTVFLWNINGRLHPVGNGDLYARHVDAAGREDPSGGEMRSFITGDLHGGAR
jgi:hypothetical protein